MVKAVSTRRCAANVRLPPKVWCFLGALAMQTCLLWLSAPAAAQNPAGIGEDTGDSSSIRGQVLNRMTHEPISRALVFSADQKYAALTDDYGRFVFRLPQAKEESSGAPEAIGFRTRDQQLMSVARTMTIFARKPGFLDSRPDQSGGQTRPSQSEVTIYLAPESLIVGQVNIPGSTGDMRIRVDLYRRSIRDGEKHWDLLRSFTTWADGTYRFWNLEAGTYKLGTEELLDRDPLVFTPGGALFGFPPIFYPGGSDFSAGSPIELAEGATFHANLTVVRRGYYPVKIGVENAAEAQPLSIYVYPSEHPGPGYSLGYNPEKHLIQGSLPSGNYTLEASTQGQAGATGLLNFSVSGGPQAEPTITLVPNSSISVKLDEEFNSSQSVYGIGAMAADGGPASNRKRWAQVQVMLMPDQEFGSAGAAISHPVEGSEENELIIPSVPPGRYRVHVQTPFGYAATAQSGGVNLLRQPLLVGMGGSSPAMEVTLRDDGAEVDGKIDGATQAYVYFLPLGGGPEQFREAGTTPEGTFMLSQLPPGTYRVLAFDRRREDLAYNDADVIRKLESQGQILQAEAGAKEHLRLKIIPGDDSQ